MIAREDIQALADEIAAKFPSVERVILFGSYAYGTPTAWSDVDLLVLMPFVGRPIDVRREVRRRIMPDFSSDIKVYTPEDARERYELWDPIIRHAFDKGEVLYEQNRQRVA